MITGIFVSIIDVICFIGILIYFVMFINQKKYVVAGYVNKKKEYKRDKKTLIAEVIIGIALFIVAIWLFNKQVIQKPDISTEDFVVFVSLGILFILIGIFMLLMALDDYLYGEYDFKTFYVRQGLNSSKKSQD
ncbi:MAG: hypothetical protein HUJ53_02365 [Holdemanella sp.]|nr:hypothetical protein [Holdemanella sp.]